MSTQNNEETFESRWGSPDADDYGYATIPGYILRHCAELDVTPSELAFIVQVVSFKYDISGSESRPSLSTIGERLGRTSDTARRLKNSLVKKGLLLVTERSTKGPGGYPDLPSILDFSPLREKSLALDASQNCKTGMADLQGGGMAEMPPGGMADLQGEDLEGGEDSEVQEENPLCAPARAEGAAETPIEATPPESDEHPEIEQPKRRGTKTAARPRNLRFEAVAFFGWDMKCGPYGKQTSARIGKVLKELDEAFPDPKLDHTDIANAYLYNRVQEKIAPRDPVAVVSMVHTWINAGKPDYSPRSMTTHDQPYTPTVSAPDPPTPTVDFEGFPIDMPEEEKAWRRADIKAKREAAREMRET